MQDVQELSYHTAISTPTPTRENGDFSPRFSLLGRVANSPSPPQAETRLIERIIRYALQRHAAHLLPRERVAKCLRETIPGIRSVKVMHSPALNAAHYKNLIICGSVWMCPVCASKISERRREELTAALSASDFTPMLITFTLRHRNSDKLVDIRNALMKAFDSFKSGKVWQKARRKYGWIGSIRAVEVTHGANGWHPHLHDLILLETPLSPEMLEEFTIFLKKRWLMVLKRHGRDASWANGVDIRTAQSDIADYIAKHGRLPKVTGWTLEHELTKATVKKGHKDGRTAYQLLADSMAGDDVASRLYIEYARVFKGKRQLVWSEGLRDLLGLNDEEMTDEELAAENREAAFVLVYLNLDQWKVVCGNDSRAELLAEAAYGDRERVVNWLAGLGIACYDNEHFEALIPLGAGVGIGIENEQF